MKNFIKIIFIALSFIMGLFPQVYGKDNANKMDYSKFHIGAYYLKPYARTESHIKDLADCGIDFIVNINYDKNTLDLLYKYHIGAIVTGAVPSWWGGDGKNAGKLNLSTKVSHLQINRT